MNPRIPVLSLVLLSLAACGQAGKLVLPEKPVAAPDAPVVKPTVVAPVSVETPANTPDAAPTTPAPVAPDAPKKEQP
jgi:hypothetical protein